MASGHGTIAWHELNTRHVDANIAHYRAVYGWHWEASPMPDGGTYHVATLGEQMVGGIFDMTGEPEMADVPDHWMIYLAVDDCDACVAAVSENGGQVVRAPFDVAGIGRFAIVTDAGGAALGLMQDAQ